jgi:hypothetical protein
MAVTVVDSNNKLIRFTQQIQINRSVWRSEWCQLVLAHDQAIDMAVAVTATAISS